jgi:hypothetical protein
MIPSTTDSLLMQVIDNQKHDGERLARVEELTLDLRTEIMAVSTAQRSCPARISEMQRQARHAAWVIAGKILAWVIGILATMAGAIQAVASIFGG